MVGCRVVRNQRVLAEDVRAELSEDELRDEEYREFLEFLDERGNPFFRRSKAFRTPLEVRLFEGLVVDDVMELLRASELGAVPLFPNPTRLCNSCAFRDPCRVLSEGGDPQWMLENDFISRKERVAYGTEGA